MFPPRGTRIRVTHVARKGCRLAVGAEAEVAWVDPSGIVYTRPVGDSTPPVADITTALFQDLGDRFSLTFP